MKWPMTKKEIKNKYQKPKYSGSHISWFGFKIQLMPDQMEASKSTKKCQIPKIVCFVNYPNTEYLWRSCNVNSIILWERCLSNTQFSPSLGFTKWHGYHTVPARWSRWSRWLFPLWRARPSAIFDRWGFRCDLLTGMCLFWGYKWRDMGSPYKWPKINVPGITTPTILDFLLEYRFYHGIHHHKLPSLKLTLAPENRPSQKETSLPTIHFQGLC